MLINSVSSCHHKKNNEDEQKDRRCLYLGESNASTCPAADETSQTSLVLDDAVRDSHLAAQRREEDDQLQESYEN